MQSWGNDNNSRAKTEFMHKLYIESDTFKIVPYIATRWQKGSLEGLHWLFVVDISKKLDIT